MKSVIIKIVTTCIIWLFTLPFFYIALIGMGPHHNIDRLFEYLSHSPTLLTLTAVQFLEVILFPLSVLIAIVILFAMNIGWLMNKKNHPYLVYFGSFFGIVNSIFALAVSLWFGFGLLLIPSIWFAYYLVRWHLRSEPIPTDTLIKYKTNL
ncbi:MULTISPECIES: hypothetical protein [unclassified Acinetobacter]|uniref:hypothetical protein n=1 Tax=unclassified Acinetobacter TaxID=196816 RepID=UPI0015D437C1|nr:MULTISPECIES: hypothetical protein [unclassified Acinetobacter]